MGRGRLYFLSMAMLAPLMVDVPPQKPEGSVTRFSVAYGGGSYAYITRGCEGVISKQEEDFGDAGFAVSHRFAGGPAEVGLRATVFRKMPQYESGTVVWNPNVSIEGGKFGIGVGYIPEVGGAYERQFEILPVSGHVRYGRLRGTYFSISVLEDVPLVSGGGTVSTGLGFRIGHAVGAWVGVSWPEPYDMPGVLVKTNFHLNRALDLNLSGRMGESEGISEVAGAVGLTLVIGRRPNPPPKGSAPLPLATPPDSVAPPDSLPQR